MDSNHRMSESKSEALPLGEEGILFLKGTLKRISISIVYKYTLIKE